MPGRRCPGAEPWIGSNIDGCVRVGIEVRARGRRPGCPAPPRRGRSGCRRTGSTPPSRRASAGASPCARPARRRGICGWSRRGSRAATASDHLVPQHHRVLQRVRLGGARQQAPRARHRQLEGVAHDALDAATGEQAGLLGDLVRRAAVQPAAEARRTRPRCSRARRPCRCRPARGRRSGHGTPGSSRIGRRFTYWSKRWRIGRISSHTDT